MADPFIAEIIMFAGNFNPRGWLLCQGQLLPISSNTALFSLVGTMYGGDGRTTFGIPDLRGRVPVHIGTGPGLGPIRQGEKGGNNTHTLIVAELASHEHTLPDNAVEDTPNQTDPTNANFAEGNFYRSGTPNKRTAPTNTNLVGGGQPFSIMQPYLGLNFIIAITGTYPSRS